MDHVLQEQMNKTFSFVLVFFQNTSILAQSQQLWLGDVALSFLLSCFGNHSFSKLKFSFFGLTHNPLDLVQPLHQISTNRITLTIYQQFLADKWFNRHHLFTLLHFWKLVGWIVKGLLILIYCWLFNLVHFSHIESPSAC